MITQKHDIWLYVIGEDDKMDIRNLTQLFFHYLIVEMIIETQAIGA